MNTEDLKRIVKGTYKSAKVVGRGTIRIDPKEVRKSPEFKDALKKAKEIVNDPKNID